jgi:anti-sigma regulatory factor (Ser/Thr protein kinase)
VSTAELALGAQPDAVPRARHFASQLLAGHTPHRAADAELVVTELVTNAILHGSPPVVLRIAQLDSRIRVEVQDGGRTLPVQPRQSAVAMTGRGLALVRAVSTAWGVEPASDGDGKLVWAEIADGGPGAQDLPPGEFDVDVIATWADLPDADVRFEVKLGAVPTDLLLEAKSHIDNVVREMALMRGDAAATGTAVAPEMAVLVKTVTEDFVEARAAIKTQALDAAGRGEPFTDLTLRLPLSAANAGERYLQALDDIDRFAREVRLLTLAPPASHRAFRRWYVQAIVDQLRAVARGDEPPLPPLFPQVLAAEVNRLAAVPSAGPQSPKPIREADDAGNLSAWRLTDAVRACSYLRTCTADAVSMEAAARSIIRYFRSAFTDPSTGKSAFVLARLFKTEEFCNLPAELRERARSVAGEVTPKSRFLTLIATDGDELAWRDRRQSRAHQLLPLLSPEAVEKAPMVSALARELGVGVDAFVHGAAEADTLRADFDVFHVEDAAGSPHLPGQEFVREHGVQSVLGFGGLLPSGHVFAVVLFSRLRIPEETARLFRTIALSVKLGLLPHVTRPLFDHYAVAPQRPPIGELAQISALEEMLDVHERTALEQAAALEERDERLRREAEIVETLRQVGEALSAVLDVDAVVHLTTSSAVDVTGAQFGAFFYNVQNDAGESYMLYTLAGVPREAFANFPMPRNTPVFGPTFRGDGIVRSDDIKADPRYGKVAPHHGMPPGHLPVRSYLAVPVVSPTSHEVLGGLFFGHERVGVFDERAERLAGGIAAQTAIALDNATLYRRERQTAVQLQQALLPGEPPRTPHLTVAHRYRPGTAGLNVGGDWYDVICLDGDRVALVIGDVMGRGVRAAATMGQLRTSIRAFAAVDLAPAAIAARLNQIIVDLPDEQIATFLYAVYDARTRTLTYTSAGHLPPVLTTTDGDARTLPCDLGPPLGIPSAHYAERVIPVTSGDAIALFTDGLVESRARSIDEGLAAVQQLLDRQGATPEKVCDNLLTALADAADEDDIALLYARFR